MPAAGAWAGAAETLGAKGEGCATRELKSKLLREGLELNAEPGPATEGPEMIGLLRLPAALLGCERPKLKSCSERRPENGVASWRVASIEWFRGSMAPREVAAPEIRGS